MTWVLEARGGTNDLKPFGLDVETLPKATEQQTDFRTSCAAIKVPFVQHSQNPFGWIAFEPCTSLVEAGPLQRAHQHVLKHGVVGNQQIRWSGLYFLACHEFHISRQSDGPSRRAARVLPLGVLVPEPG